ncbi:MAG: cytochrome c biogenesis protein CcsA [Burkholderiaceae bacterium]|nr:cytochrome c biogenesis protein CcsA [Burkholderiaceae bacterium]
MTTDGFYGAGSVAVAAVYLATTWATWRTLEAAENAARWRGTVLPLLAAAHALLLGLAVWSGGEFRFGFAHALSATLLVAVIVLWVEGMFVSVRGLDVLVLPAAAVSVLLPLAFQGAPIGSAVDSLALRLHLLVAIAAYSLLTIAALHALLMALLDRRLHSPPQAPASGFARIFGQLPSLLALEKLLFRLIGAGFVLLTATLLGAFGWRGRTALRWTFAGFLMLLLAYVGSRFVLEVVLGRV